MHYYKAHKTPVKNNQTQHSYIKGERMTELLAPAGSMESLKVAISNGCNAVYLGMQQFGARAYSDNFTNETLKEAVIYAHLRDVKVYVTINTIVFENELSDVYHLLHFLNKNGVDGVIVQDLAILEYIATHFEDMEAHCSTQMGIDDTEGALLCKELGAKRVVVAREVSIEKAQRIKEDAEIEVEAFIHGALCVSYSGNCIMSGMTGNRSGNRGRCIGSCRKLYDIIEVPQENPTLTQTEDKQSAKKILGRSYILSTKDLNTIDQTDSLKALDSLKIEGRMKEPIYVANVVSRYRMALDGVATPNDIDMLNRTFNRTYTKGYLFHEDKKDIVNTERPNHFGYRIGAISGRQRGMYRIELNSPLQQNDLIRIRHKNEDINFAAAKIYDSEGKLINCATKTCHLKLKEKLSTGDIVYKTKDIAYEKELESHFGDEFQRFPLDIAVYAYPDAPLVVAAKGLGIDYTYESPETLSEAINQPTLKEAVIKQFSRLNDTVFCLGDVIYEEYGAFIPAKILNTARKNIVENIYQEKIASKPRRLKRTKYNTSCIENQKHLNVQNVCKPELCAFVITQEQYDACKECGLETIYFHNVVPRNNTTYQSITGEVLIGGLGGIYHYRTTNPFITDYSLNVVNSKSCRILHDLGAKRITLSYEINEKQIDNLLNSYFKENGTLPSLEMIIYGHAPLLVTRYCPLKTLNQCGTCRTKRYEIKDELFSFPLLSHQNCDTTILNGKTLNLIDEMLQIKGVEMFRLNFTTENATEVRKVITTAQEKLNGTLYRSAFNPETDTRGYFNKEIL